MQNLADLVARRTGGAVRGATLAKKGALEAAATTLSHPRVFPHFMSDGWFVSTNLQERLAAAGLESWTTLAPLGLSAALRPIAARRLRLMMDAAGLPVGETTLVVAAHGSPSDPRPAEAAEAFAGALRAKDFFKAVRAGYVDEEPSLAEAASVSGPAIVLPFFAARAGHVLLDLPEALSAAGFDGPVLPPIGTWDEVPLLIADAVRTMAAAE